MKHSRRLTELQSFRAAKTGHETWLALNGLAIKDATKRAEWFWEQTAKGLSFTPDERGKMVLWDQHRDFFIKALAENLKELHDAAFREGQLSALKR